MRWSQTFSEAENRFLEKCEKENRLNPYQSETLEHREHKGLVDIDSSSEDSRWSEESDELEESDHEEVTTNPYRVPENQPNQEANTLLGNKIHIIENKCWEDNYLLRDYLNLEQDLHWKIMIVQRMITNKEPWWNQASFDGNKF